MVRHGDVSYTRFLLCSAMALLPIEGSLEETNVAAVLPDWSQRRRSHTLRLDLAEMSLPEPPSLPAPEVLGNAFQFGMLYVLEGSRLGNSGPRFKRSGMDYFAQKKRPDQPAYNGHTVWQAEKKGQDPHEGLIICFKRIKCLHVLQISHCHGEIDDGAPRMTHNHAFGNAE
jgi:hypothetical protein